jgi:hypothetical protein
MTPSHVKMGVHLETSCLAITVELGYNVMKGTEYFASI